jgi:hypothetical protein
LHVLQVPAPQNENLKFYRGRIAFPGGVTIDEFHTGAALAPRGLVWLDTPLHFVVATSTSASSPWP